MTAHLIGTAIGVAVIVLLVCVVGLGLELRRERREWEADQARLARAIGAGVNPDDEGGL